VTRVLAKGQAMRKINLELVVGFFVLAAVLCFVYMTVRVGEFQTLVGREYELVASFANVGGLRPGASVFIAGVPVGRVERIALDDYRAKVVMSIGEGTAIQEDAIASVRTRGLLGEPFLEISPGASETILKPGELIRETEPAIDIQALIAKYVFSDKSEGGLE